MSRTIMEMDYWKGLSNMKIIFLDIDGVMYDWNNIKSNNINISGIVDKFSKQSVDALNYLTKQLSTEYTPVIVISSTWRRDMFFTIQTLKANGVSLDLRNLTCTPISIHPEKRGLEILRVLNTAQNKQNYVIIDDESFDFAEHFPKHKIIKTNIFNDSLNKNKVDTFFQNNNLLHLCSGDEYSK